MKKVPPRILLLLGVWIPLLWVVLGDKDHQVDGFPVRSPLPLPLSSSRTRSPRQQSQRQQSERSQPQDRPNGGQYIPPPLQAVPKEGGGGGGGGSTDGVRRLSHVVRKKILGPFTSAWMTGYLAGSLWDLVRRGPTTIFASGRGSAWGMDFGIVSAIFSGTPELTAFLLDLIPFFSLPHNNNNNNTKKQQSQQQSQSVRFLWSTVLRNILLAVYFGRHQGLFSMVRSSILYGGLTYYFVSRKLQRDHEAWGVRSPPQSSSSSSTATATTNTAAIFATLQDFLQQQQQQQQPQRGSTIRSPPSPSAFFHTAQSSPINNNNNKNNKNNKTKIKTTPTIPDNVVDVEFEKVMDDKTSNNDNDNDIQQ